MKPTKYCDCIQCSDCPSYKDCEEYEVESLLAQGKLCMPEIKWEKPSLLFRKWRNDYVKTNAG